VNAGGGEKPTKFTRPETKILMMEEILHQLLGSFFFLLYFYGFIHYRWSRISSINSNIALENR